MSNAISVVQTDSVIVSLMRASTALVEAKTIQHTMQIVSLAAAAEIWAKRQQLGAEAEGIAFSIKVEALRSLGGMLKATPRSKGVRGQLKGRNSSGGTDLYRQKNQAETLAELRIDKRTSVIAQKLAELPDAAFEQVREGNETISKALAKAKADKDAQAGKPQVKAKPKAEAKPTKAKPDAQEPADDGPDAAELASNDAAVKADMDAIQKILESDDKLAAAYAEIKRLNAELAVVKVARDGWMNQANDSVKRIKALQRKLDQAAA